MSDKTTTPRFTTISEMIKEGITTSANGKAVDIVVNNAIDKEINARADLIVKGYEEWASTVKKLKACVPDIKTYPIENRWSILDL